MIKNLSLYILLLCSCYAFAQQGSNPFDIKGRIGSANIVIEAAEQDSIILDSIIVEQSVEESTVHVDEGFVDSSNEVLTNNPFDVRKNPRVSNGPADPEAKEEQQNISNKPNNKTLIPAVPEQNKSNSKVFVFWVLLFLMVVLASVINLKRNSFSNLYRSISNENYLRLIQREENNGLSPLFLILNSIFYINGGLFIYLVSQHFGANTGFTFFIGAVIALFAIYFIRITSMNLLAFIFPVTKEAKQYNFTILLYNNFIGILLIVINLMIAYGPNFFSNLFVYLGFILVGLFYLLRIFRGLLNSLSYINKNFFHFFLYLCTFEIATVFILIKVVQNWTI